MDEQIVEGQVLTPTPKKQDKIPTFDFPEAIRQIIAGRKVSRVEWANQDYGFLNNDLLSISRNGNFHSWIVNDGDMLANDWMVVNESN